MISTIDSVMTRLTYAYIVLPFLLFCSLWLNLPAATVFGGITLVSWVLAWRNIDALQFVRIDRSVALGSILILAIIVFFSGIGSYTYQNEDFPYRNALFNDLVHYPWPVMYQVEGFDGHFLNGQETVMTYYLGYYLPAALVGKFLGMQAGQFFLYFWTLLGTVIVVYQIGKYVNRFSYAVLWMFLGWGTLFFVGALLKYPLEKYGTEGNYLWAGMRLYANSNLGSIYWIFNQSLTAWPIILLILNRIPAKNTLFVYSFTLFLSPFCFVGFFPFLLYLLFEDYKKQGKAFVLPYLSFQNLAGGLAVVLLTFVYLQSNPAGQKFHYIPFSSFKVFVAFMALSWGVVALLLLPKFRQEPLYWLCIAVLLPLPFFQQGNGMDFPGRVSMPAFLILMLLAMRLVLEERRSISRIGMIAYFVVAGTGHFISETGISMYRTAYANLSYRTEVPKWLKESDHAKLRIIGEDMELIKHKDVLTRDPFKTVVHPDNPVIWNYMAPTEGSIFYRYLAKKKEPDAAGSP